MLVNLLLCSHALYVLYTVIPILTYLFFIILRKKDKEKFLIFIFWFLCPLIIFYFIVITLEGFTIIFWDNLSLNFLVNNFLLVVKEGFIPGIKEIFFHSHIPAYTPENNVFISVFIKLIDPPYNMEPEYTFLIIYFFSFLILIF